MKSSRLLLLGALGVLALLGLVVATAFAPPVQQWAVRRALAGEPGTEVAFSRLSFGPRAGEVEGLDLTRDGLRVRAARVEVDYSPVAFLFRREVDVRRFVATGLEVDASAAPGDRAGAGMAGGPAAVPGAIGQVRLPWKLSVGELRVDGRLLLPGPAGRGPVAAAFTISGGGLRPGQEGRFALDATVQDPTPGARVERLHASGALRVRQAESLAFDAVALAVAVDATGPQFAAANQLRVDASLRSGPERAEYSLRVDTAVGGAVTPLLAVKAEAPPDGSRFSGTWNLRTAHGQVEPFFLGGPLPRFSVAGEGTLSVEPAARALALAGRIEGDAEGLEAFDPALRALGRLQVRAEFDGAVSPGRARLARLGVDVSAGAKVIEARLVRGVAVDLRAGSVELASGEGEVGRLRLDGLPVAWIRPFVSGADLAGGAVTGEILAGGDARALLLETVAPLRVRGVSAAREGRLLVRDADLAAAGRVRFSSEGLRVELTEATLATAGGDQARVRAAFDLPRDGATPATLRLEGDADLPRLLEPFAPVGALRLAGRLEAALAGGKLEVRALRGEVGDGPGRRWVSGELTAPLSLDLAAGRLVDAGPAEVALGRVTVEALKLDEIAALRPLGPLAGTTAPVAFTLAARAGRLIVKAETPWRWDGVAIGPERDRRLVGLGLRTAPAVDFGSRADWRLTDGGTSLVGPEGAALADLKLDASAGADGTRASLAFTAELAALGRQPALASLAALGGGRATGELRARRAPGTGMQVEGRTTLNGLVLREGNQALPVANVNVRAVRDAAGRTTVELPILLDRVGQRTDLLLAVEVAPEAGARRFAARLTGEHVELADVLALAALARPSPGAVPAPGAAAAVVADSAPFWAGWRGRLDVDVKSLVRGADWQASGLAAEATVDDAQLRLARAGARWGERGEFSAQGTLAFRGGARPYALDGGFTLTELDVGALLRGLDAERSPVVEGVFATTGRFAGVGRTLDDTLAAARGEFELRSRQGFFRGLRRTTERVSVATRAVDAVAALGSLFGSERVKGAAERVAGQAYQVDQLAQALAELPFDQLVVRARRDETLDLKVEELSLLSPEVRLHARGTVTHAADRPLLEQPLALTYQLAARGRIEQTLARLRALDGTKDDLGYSRVRDVGTITGTVGRPQPNQFFLRLAEAKLGEFLN